ncbi:hypothetical protein SEA_CLUBPENGUIN_57 [Streptomyces phage ClubPenguin]|nr:hypothetical protein SEA_CLUBPENGUIN_57 [Streptomyces phage ClubPenguin]
MKFVIGVAVGWFLFHPVKKDSKFDQTVEKAMRSGGEKLASFIIGKFDKVVGDK